MIEKNRLA